MSTATNAEFDPRPVTAAPVAAGPRASTATIALTWRGQDAGRRHRALLIPIVLLHAGLLWTLVQSMTPATLSPATPTYIRWLPETGPQPPAPPPLPTPERAAPRPHWAPVPDVVVMPTQADPVSTSVSPQAPAPAPAPGEIAAAPAVAPKVPSRAAPAERQVSISEVAYLTPPILDYPLTARRRREEGVVHVRVRVDAGGRPDQAAVIRSSGHAALDLAALATVRATRFKPYTEDGVPRPFWVVMPLVFELES